MKEIGRRSWRIVVTSNRKEKWGLYTDYWPENFNTTTLTSCLRQWAYWRKKGWDNDQWQIKFVNAKSGEVILADIF